MNTRASNKTITSDGTYLIEPSRPSDGRSFVFGGVWGGAILQFIHYDTPNVLMEESHIAHVADGSVSFETGNLRVGVRVSNCSPTTSLVVKVG